MKLASGLTLTTSGFQLLMFGRRKEGLTPDQYRDHYENVHIPLMKNLTGDTFPLTHERHYVKRDGPPDFPAAVLMGNQAGFDYDAVAVLTYRDKAHFDANWAFFEDEETSKLIKEDEEKFSAWVTGVFIGQTITTDSRA
ncbi:hypothetical protein ABOM_002432 [Aspergillus bombycis]|uniref:EthD domain-containing protein n=1 Tax=Aspergillus bombycis TaxID=109264 RepID=A0A1F8A9T1_9EURO|nr:hypothetical protein ABOM_002432 [Aspergillus bombycis]OGM48500.1 hypothetical protein ABOM_002432 [Aspergillus bombycis]